MRNKRLVKTAVCGAILSASLMVSQQNINAAQEGSALSSEAKKNETSQNISESDTEQNAAANENQPQDSNSDPSSPGAGNPDEKQMTQKITVQRIQMLPLTERYLTSLQMRAISPFL